MGKVYYSMFGSDRPLVFTGRWKVEKRSYGGYDLYVETSWWFGLWREWTDADLIHRREVFINECSKENE